MGKTTLFLGGEILCANARDELAEAMLIEDGQIVFVGDEGDAIALSDSDTEIIDLEKRAVIPGFINTYPLNFLSENTEVKALERKAREALSLGWTALRLTSECLACLRKLVADGEITATLAPYLFALYERAELLSERCRFICFASSALASESAVRQAEWAISDRRPIAFEVSEEQELRRVREFLLSLPARRIPSSRNRLYLSGALSPKHLPLLLSNRLLPVFLGRDRESGVSLLAFRELGLPALKASAELISPLRMLSEVLTPLADDYRVVPPLLSAATLHAAELESVADELGSLEWGKRADFLILSEPLLGCPPSRLPRVLIAESWIGGQRLATLPLDASDTESKIIFKRY